MRPISVSHVHDHGDGVENVWPCRQAGVISLVGGRRSSYHPLGLPLCVYPRNVY